MHFPESWHYSQTRELATSFQFPAMRFVTRSSATNSGFQIEYGQIGVIDDSRCRGCNGFVTADGRYLIIRMSNGTTSNNSRITYKDLEEPYGMPIDLISNFDAEYSFVENDGP